MISKKSKPFYETEEGLEQEHEEAIEKLDKRIGWYDTGNGHDKDWSYSKLLARYKHLREITLKNMPNIWTGLEFALS